MTKETLKRKKKDKVEFKKPKTEDKEEQAVHQEEPHFLNRDHVPITVSSSTIFNTDNKFFLFKIPHDMNIEDLNNIKINLEEQTCYSNNNIIVTKVEEDEAHAELLPVIYCTESKRMKVMRRKITTLHVEQVVQSNKI
jgi:hypothetical protein